MLLNPFEYSNGLVLESLEEKINPNANNPNLICYTFYRDEDIDSNIFTKIDDPSLLIIPYFPESEYSRSTNSNYAFIEVDWHDPGFKNLLKTMIAPKLGLSKFTLPSGRISIGFRSD